MLNAYLYKKGKTLETDVNRTQMFQALSDKECLLWVDLENASEFESELLVEIFNFHELTVEDCLTESSVPKIDDYEEYLFLVTHAMSIVPQEEAGGQRKDILRLSEVDIFLGGNYVVTFHRETAKALVGVRDGARKRPQHYMAHGPDYLVHAILDQLVDGIEPVLRHYDEKVDCIEEEIFNHPKKNFMEMLMRVKKDIFNLRRFIAPQRDILGILSRHPSGLIKKKHMIYFRDIYDHLVRMYGIAESFHESFTAILQVYFSYSSHKLNEVMKRMTVLATLSMPSLMIASIYGMNFKNMPELAWPFGYFASLAVMALLAIVMLIWMKFKKWI